jgi:hypothetical protein
MKHGILRSVGIAIGAVIAARSTGIAQGVDETGLAKQTQNPLASLVSVPIQYNFTTGGSLAGQTSYDTRVQPVAPLAVGRSWNLITRPIITFLSVRRSDGGRSRGVGNIELQEYFVSTKATSTIVGFGPVLSFPTATIDEAHTGAWAGGPALALVHSTGPFVLSALVSQAWSFAGDKGHADVNIFGIQPSINYNLGNGWAVATAPQIVADFTIDRGQQWTVPVGIALSKVTAVGNQSVNLGLQYYNYTVRPRDRGASLLRFVTSFLFPKVPATT